MRARFRAALASRLGETLTPELAAWLETTCCMDDVGYTLETEFEPVFQFVHNLMPGMTRDEGMSALGLRKDGQLIVGVIYEGFNGRNVWMHVAAAPGARWAHKNFLDACFDYPFEVLGAARVSGYVSAGNAAARKLDEHLGFKEEARLCGAAADGGDVILYVMWKKECRYGKRQQHARS